MSFYEKPRFWIVAGVTASQLPVSQQFWQWEVEHQGWAPEVPGPPSHRWGKDLPPRQILAPDESYKGIMLEVRRRRRRFLNPIFWGYEIPNIDRGTDRANAWS